MKDSLALDLTLNPDFSQVESDEPQITVNQRFEVFFPEKRPFFLENSSFFRTPINLLFTRRIADPQYGARVSGKLGRYALGALIIDDRAPGERVPITDPLFGKRAYFGVIRMNYDMFRESTLGVIATTRQFQGSFNRVLGPDLRLKLNLNWVLDAQVVTSQTQTLNGQRLSGPAYRAQLNRAGRSFNTILNYIDISPGFRTDAGFVNRVDLRDVDQYVRYRVWPERKAILFWEPHLFLQRLWNHDGIPQDWTVEPGFEVNLRRPTRFWGSYRVRHERFQGVDFGKRTIIGAVDIYSFSRFSSLLRLERGQEINFSPAAGLLPFLANQTTLESSISLKPFKSLRIDNHYLFSRLIDRGTAASIFNNHTARMKINYQFTRRLSLRSIFQYESTLANRTLTTLDTTKRVTSDFLVTYLVNPGTALYVGYGDLLENLDPRLLRLDGQLLRTRSSFHETSKQFFVKFSYLFRF